MATTKLHTPLTFTVLDMQGKHNFPTGPKGLVFEHREQRVVTCRSTGRHIKRDARYVIRTDDTNKGWRIDLLPKLGPAEAVYGVAEGRPSYWPTAQDAASALVGALDEIAANSSLGVGIYGAQLLNVGPTSAPSP